MKHRKAKVAILGPFPPATGGIATNIQNLLKSPLQNRYTLLKFRTMSSKYGTSQYAREKLLAKIIRVLVKLFCYSFFLQKESPQIVHINSSFGRWAFWRDSLYLLISKIFRKKVVFQLHGGKLDEFWSHCFYPTRALIKQIFKMPELIAVLSSIQRKPFIEIGFERKVKVVPNTVDLTTFKIRNNYRIKFGIPKHRVVVLFIASHFDKEKGIIELLKAIWLLTREYKRILFVFVGGGKEKYSMIRFCKEKNLEKYVKFTGYLYNNAIIKILHSSDILVLPSHSEGFPLVILEAMAAGLAIVSTPVGAIPEVIKNGDNGFLVKPRDYAALAEKIARLVEDGELRKKISANNVREIKEKYDLKIVAKVFEQSYEAILADNSSY